jgi:hypothetical protein
MKTHKIHFEHETLDTEILLIICGTIEEGKGPTFDDPFGEWAYYDLQAYVLGANPVTDIFDDLSELEQLRIKEAAIEAIDDEEFIPEEQLSHIFTY